MKNLSRFTLALLTLAACLLPGRAHAFGWPNPNDSIFPPTAAAKPFIDFDGKGFLIKGKRTFIVSGELQYPRTPRAMWRDRLLRIKRAGYNTIQTYAFWNYHEPQEGKFEFSGEKDFDAYLKLIHSLDMYAIVRMGPYVNAEWDTGGLPVWLRFGKPGLLPMQDNPQFYKAVDPYFAKLVPIIQTNQINHGGAVIMVQMENENTTGGGTDLPNAYYKRFYAKMRTMGLQVPLFFSGLNHSDDPAGDAPFDISQRTSPWYSTEFWTGWVGRYGTEPERTKKLERATWKVIAYGGAGYTHYTLAGGTDFDTWNNNEQAASYDFGSPIGQAGDLRDGYYLVKRAALFATSFADVLSNSLASSGGSGAGPTDGRVQITRRKGPAGEILFLDNRTGEAVPTQIKMADGKVYPAAGPITVDSGEILPIVHGYPLTLGVNLSLAAARVLGVSKSGTLTTLVTYGKPGEPTELRFAAKNASVVGDKTGMSVTPTTVTIQTKIPSGEPQASVFRVGSRTVRVLTMSTDMADRTWVLQGGRLIACGPDYVGTVEDSGGKLRLSTERRGLEPRPASALPRLLYTATTNAPLRLAPDAAMKASTSAAPPPLSAWQMEDSLPMTKPGYKDAAWKASTQPLPMGADGDISEFAWYRTQVKAPETKTYQLDFSDVGDWVTCFVDGKRVASSDVRTRYQAPVSARLSLPLTAGTHTLALLTSHAGRNKLFNYYGPLDTIDAKGISGPVSLTVGSVQTLPVTAFRWIADDRGPDSASTQAAVDLNTAGNGWQDAGTTTDVFNGRTGWAWFRTTLPAMSGPHRRIHFSSIDDNGQVYLNGKQIASDVGINADRDISLDEAWKKEGPNVLAVAVHNDTGAGGLLGDVRLLGGITDGQPITGWKMRGGVTPPALSSAAWQPLSGSDGPNVPAFYHATFSYTPFGAVGPHPILRVSLAGLSRGTMWINGRNVGRYPEVSPIDSVYLPESLLRPGKNGLIIFDEEGKSPTQAKLVVETGASRTAAVLVPVSALHAQLTGR